MIQLPLFMGRRTIGQSDHHLHEAVLPPSLEYASLGTDKGPFCVSPVSSPQWLHRPSGSTLGWLMKLLS